MNNRSYPFVRRFMSLGRRRRLSLSLVPCSHALVVAVLLTLPLLYGCGSAPKKADVTANLAAVAVAKPVAVDQSFRQQTPTPSLSKTLTLPVPTKTVLDNGLTLFVVPKPGLPLVHIEVVLKSGAAQDPAGKEGVSSFTADLLKQGTTDLTAEQLADTVETLGTSIDIDVDEDSTSIGFTALTDTTPQVLDVLAEILQTPKFAPAEIERLRKQRLAALEQSKDNPGATAQRVFRKVVYANHPYGHTSYGTAPSVTKISAKDVQVYFAKHYRPENAAVIVVGDLEPSIARQQIESRLSDWRGAPGVTKPPAPAKALAANTTLVHKASAPQSQLMIGHLGVARSDADYYPLVLCNSVLGGLFNSRINMNLREVHGYTYGARSYFDFMRAPGSFFVSTGVRTDVTGLAINEVLLEIDRIRNADITQLELDNAKSRYTLTLPDFFQTVQRIADMTASLYLFDLPLDYYRALPEAIAKVTVADVRRVAQTHLKPKALSIVVVGDKTKVQAELTALKRGKVTLRDADGKVL